MKIFGCHGNELPIKEILYQSVFCDKYYMIGHKFTISVTMDVSPFAWCLARAVLNFVCTDLFNMTYLPGCILYTYLFGYNIEIKHYTIIDFNEVDIGIYLQNKSHYRSAKPFKSR